MNILEEKFWAGTEECLVAYLASLKKEAGMSYTQDNSAAEPALPAPRLFSQIGNVGVIKVAGPLNNTDSWMNEYRGATGYPEIRAALVHAASDPSVGAILLDVASGGGAVSGVSDAADLVALVGKSKPVHAFTDSQMASAALWVTANAKTITVGKIAEIGSIGVMAVHQEMSKMMADAGVTATVFRSGQYKALGTAFEPLSKTASDVMQAQINELGGIFTQHMADARGVSYAQADAKFGQGRTFIGQAAVDVGLADAVGSFDSVVSKLQRGIDSRNSLPKYGANFTKGPDMSKAALTEQQIAAMAEGGVTQVAQVGGPTAAELAAAAEAKASADAAAKAEADTAAAALASATNKPAEKAEPTLVAYLQSQLSAAQASVVELNVQLVSAKATLEAAQGSNAAMRPLVVASVDRLQIALGQAPGGADKLADAELLGKHATLRDQFEAKFKAGGVAAVSATDDKSVKTAAASDLHRARVQSTRISTK